MTLPTGFLALPAEGDTTLATLTRKLRLLALGHLLEAASERHARSLRAVRAGLARIARSRRRRELVAAVGRIDVLTPALLLGSGMREDDALLGFAIPHLLAELSRRCGRHLPETLLWDVSLDTLCIGDRVVRWAPPAAGVLADPSGIEVRSASGERLSVDGEVALHPIAGDVALATHDDNPIASLEGHPDKDGNALDLAGRPPTTWCAALAEALHLIEIGLPNLHTEIVSSLQRIVPVGFDDKRHQSASYREAPGLAYLSLHPSSLTLAEAIVHETQHGKLNTLTWFDPVLHNGQETWTSSPVRPDMRPLLGVMMAVHAFVPVAALHHNLQALDHPEARNADARYEEALQKNTEGLETLRELARPTKLGRRVLDALEDLHAAITG